MLNEICASHKTGYVSSNNAQRHAVRSKRKCGMKCGVLNSISVIIVLNQRLAKINGGERGIRTLETVPRLHTFQACAFDHSATSPHIRLTGKYPDMPAAVKAVALTEKPALCRRLSPVRIERHYSQDAPLGNRYLTGFGDNLGLEGTRPGSDAQEAAGGRGFDPGPKAMAALDPVLPGGFAVCRRRSCLPAIAWMF